MFLLEAVVGGEDEELAEEHEEETAAPKQERKRRGAKAELAAQKEKEDAMNLRNTGWWVTTPIDVRLFRDPDKLHRVRQLKQKNIRNLLASFDFGKLSTAMVLVDDTASWWKALKLTSDAAGKQHFLALLEST